MENTRFPTAKMAARQNFVSQNLGGQARTHTYNKLSIANPALESNSPRLYVRITFKGGETPNPKSNFVSWKVNTLMQADIV